VLGMGGEGRASRGFGVAMKSYKHRSATETPQF